MTGVQTCALPICNVDKLQAGDNLFYLGTIPSVNPNQYSGVNSYLQSMAIENYTPSTNGSMWTFGSTPLNSTGVIDTVSIYATVTPKNYTVVDIGDIAQDFQPVINMVSRNGNVSISVPNVDVSLSNHGSLYFGNPAVPANWMHMTPRGDLVPDLGGNLLENLAYPAVHDYPFRCERVHWSLGDT